MSVSVNGTNGLTFNDGSTQNTSAYGGGFAMRNRIINGAMVIDQRNAGASVTVADGGYPVDRWRYAASQASKFSAGQNLGSVTPPAGFANYMGFSTASAVSIGSSDYFLVDQRVEGFNFADVAWGTANAQAVTLSFWVRSSLTGTFGGSLKNQGSTRSYPFSFSISSANTWEQKSITIAGDTSGTWNTGNLIGVYVTFGLGVGSTFSGTAGAWAGSNYVSATSATSVVGTSGATFYITGVQLEKGSTATSFDYRPYSTELQLAQRYFALNTPGCGKANSTTQMAGTVGVPVVMRATPTATLFNGTNKANDVGNAFRNITSLTVLEGASATGGHITSVVATTTSGAVHTYMGEAFAFSAEL